MNRMIMLASVLSLAVAGTAGAADFGWGDSNRFTTDTREPVEPGYFDFGWGDSAAVTIETRASAAWADSPPFTVDTETVPCESDADCEDGDLCTCDVCEDPPESVCVQNAIASRPYADVFPVPCGDGAVEIMDTLCVLDAASATGECLTVVGGCMMGDIFPCPPPEGDGCDGAVEIMDTLAVLDAASGDPGCSPWCP